MHLTGSNMRKTLTLATMSVLGLGWPPARAAPPDTSSMPQLDLPQATPPEDVAAAPIVAFTATGASNYTFRGISQTENQAAVFGAGRVSYDNFYAGAGVENVNFHNSTTAEYDLSAGWTPVIDKFRLDIGVIRYGYIDQPAHTYIDTVEFMAAVLRDFGRATLGAAVYYSGNYFGTHRDDVYVEGRGAYRITQKLKISGAFGKQSDGLLDHITWNAGATYAITKHLALDLRYADTDEHTLGKIYGSHYTAALKVSF
jgi:uncharacterized protein (TIGR02001 family)